MAPHAQVRSVLCVTFGSPRVGGSSFAEAFNAQVEGWRFVHKSDMVCALPLLGW
jgi:hypothetical protein